MLPGAGRRPRGREMTSKRLARLRANPAGDWKIADIEAVCREHGIACEPPTGGGSHYKVFHPSNRDILTIPSKRPVKAIYVRMLVRFIDAVINDR